MFLTVLKMTRSSILNTKNPLNIYSGNDMHKWLTAQQDSSRLEDKILYKIKSTKDDIYIYIQSKTIFNVNNIEKYGMIFVKSFEIILKNEGEYYFDLQAFPYKTKNDKRLYLTNIDERYEWLKKQLNKYNIELIECTEYSTPKITLDKDKIKKVPSSSFKGRIYIKDIAMSFKGRIYIKDIAMANNLLEQGLGRFKNYGLGLLLIK